LGSRVGRRLGSALLCFTWFGFAVSTPSTAIESPRFDSPWIGYDTAVYPEGIGPWGSTTGDFDGDGDDDLATVSWGGTAYLSILRSDGRGGYAPPETTPLLYESLDLVSGDFDQDGDLDLVVSDTGRFWEGITVSLYTNDGAGHFTRSSSSNTGINGASGITTADFDGDGWLDVAVAHDEYIEFGNTAAVLLNNQTGAFDLLQLISLSSGTREIDSGDLDGDGDPDLVVAHETNLFTVLINLGGGVMLEQATYPGLDAFIAEFPDVHLADVDLDGDLDLFYSNTGTGHFGTPGVGLWLNGGDASFGAPLELNFNSESNGGNGIHTADVTGDQRPDLLVTTGSSGQWFLFPSAEAGGFDSPKLFRAGETPFRIETPDLDLDGDLDVMVLGTGSLEACVYLNPGDGSFVQPPVIDMTEPSLAPAFPTNLQAGDLDLDGDLDLVLGYRSDFSNEDGISVRLNEGDGTFGPFQKYIESTYPLSVRLGDLENDDDLDLVWLDGAGNIKRRANSGAGQFGPTQTIRTVFADFMDLFDIESDGDLDIIVATGFEVSVLLNDGAGAFGSTIDTAIGGFFNIVGMGEFNGDGDLDLLTDSAVQGYAEISNGNGDGTFAGTNTVVTGRDVHAFATADLDHNGDLDFVALYNLDEKGISALRGRGIGDFFPVENFHSSFGSYDQTSSLQLSDLDGDTFVDAATAAFSPQDLAYWRGIGDGTFGRLERYGVGQPAFDVAVGDFDGDGIQDAAVATQTDSGVWWYPGIVLLKGLPVNSASPLELSVSQLSPGSEATWTATGAEPGERVRIFATTSGLGAGPCPAPLGGLCLDLLTPIRSLGTATADANGTASLTLALPDSFPVGETVQSQAVILRGDGGNDSIKSEAFDSEVTR